MVAASHADSHDDERGSHLADFLGVVALAQAAVEIVVRLSNIEYSIYVVIVLLSCVRQKSARCDEKKRRKTRGSRDHHFSAATLLAHYCPAR